MSDPRYDGLCGIPCPAPLADGRYLRCKLGLAHDGDHDWANVASRLVIKIESSCTYPEPVPPRRCFCTAVRDEHGVVVEYLFAPDCPTHAKRAL
jgi:hypothetical protein